MVTYKHLNTWSVHKKLMESECEGLQWRGGVSGCACLEIQHHPDFFDLFVQWLYTGRYQEEDGLVQFPQPNLILLHPQDLDIASQSLVDWAVKAAIASWELGASLGAKNFQNYAIERLFEAFSRPPSRPLTATVFMDAFAPDDDYCSESTWHLQKLVHDVVFWNWGDSTVVDHSDQETWSAIFGSCPYLCKRFVAATSQSLDERREKALRLADYISH
jgi:hypothetical protein